MTHPLSYGRQAPTRDAGADGEFWCRTLGELSLYRSPVDSTPLMRAGKPLAILVYLALTPGGRADRDRIAGLLWPGAGQKDAHHSLRQSLYRLRLTTDNAALAHVSGTEVVLQPRVRFDCLEGERAVEQRDWDRGYALLRGNFLEGFSIPESREFEDWAESQRARFRSNRAAAGLALGEELLRRGEASGALEVAEELLVLLPFDDDPVYLLMRALTALDRLTTAIAHFHAFAQFLSAEMDDEPGEELTAYARELERVVKSRAVRTTVEPQVDELTAAGAEASVVRTPSAQSGIARRSIDGVTGDEPAPPPRDAARQSLPGGTSTDGERRARVRPLTWYVRAGLGLLHQDAVVDAPQRDRGIHSVPRRLVRLDRRTGIVLAALFALAVTGLAISRMVNRASGDATAPAEPSVVPRPLANDAADEAWPSLSPEGSRVVYSWKREDAWGLYIKPIDGPPRRLLACGTGHLQGCNHAKWSPTGDLIAFLTMGDAGSRNVWVISPAGGHPRLLTSASGIGLAWTPDGQSLAFVDRNSPGEPFSIFSVPLRGGPRRRLTVPPLGTFGDTHSAFSPDGRRLAVVRYWNLHQSDLFVVPVGEPESERVERLTTGSAGMTGVDWSPDGGAIVFGSHQGLWKVSLTGARTPTRVAPFNGGAYFPAFSRASGRGSPIRLVYQSSITDVNIWRWDPARRQASKIAGSTWYDDFPAIARDAGRVAFASNRTGENEIWIADADGSNPQQVTFHRGPVVMAPAWSPDGQRLAFSSEVGGNRDIYVIRPDGSQSTRITMAPSEETNPSWSPDGRWIYFRSDQAGVGQLWKVPAAGGTPIRVTTGEALRGFPSPDGRLLYFVKSADGPGLWSVPVNGGRETFILSDVHDGYWAVADSGIFFFVVARSDGSRVPSVLRFFAFATGTMSAIPDPPGGWGYAVPGFSAARDGRFVLWTRLDNATNDLMLIDPWIP